MYLSERATAGSIGLFGITGGGAFPEVVFLRSHDTPSPPTCDRPDDPLSGSGGLPSTPIALVHDSTSPDGDNDRYG